MGRDRSKDEELSARARALAIRKAPNINHFWARLMVEELYRNGVVDFVISPGSRSTPLALAIAQHAAARYFVHYDERGAGFFALGLAQRFGAPAALVCTSGSAAANYWPAVVEASQSATPLLLLTADRPPELLDCGANQAIDQNKLYGEYVRWFVNMPCPTLEIPAIYVLSQMDEAIARAVQPTAGPVHINCAFREPLAPTPDDNDFSEALAALQLWLDAPFPHSNTCEYMSVPTDSDVLSGALESMVESAERPIVVFGGRDNIGQRLDNTAAEVPLQLPVFVETLAAGFIPDPMPSNVLRHGELLARSALFRDFLSPDLIILVGGPMLSKQLESWINESDAAILQITPDARRYNAAHKHRMRFVCDLDAALELITVVLERQEDNKADEEALQIFSMLETLVATNIATWVVTQKEITEIGIAWHIARNIQKNGLLFLGNSMPVRDMATYGLFPGADVVCAANRGASGIDGNLATAAGVAVDAASGLTVVLGDLAFLHDVNSLPLFRHLDKPVVIVVINNDGGGIFHLLPVAREEHGAEHFEAVLGTPHGMRFAGVAKTFGLRYVAPRTMDAFVTAYQKAQKGKSKITLIEVQTDRKKNAEQHRELSAAVVANIDDIFEEYLPDED